MAYRFLSIGQNEPIPFFSPDAPRRRFVWILLTGSGWIVAVWLTALIRPPLLNAFELTIGQYTSRNVLFDATEGAVIGSVIGLAQCLVLLRSMRLWAYWILTNILAWVVANTAFEWINWQIYYVSPSANDIDTIAYVIAFTLRGAILGACLTCFQWRIARRYSAQPARASRGTLLGWSTAGVPLTALWLLIFAFRAQLGFLLFTRLAPLINATSTLFFYGFAFIAAVVGAEVMEGKQAGAKPRTPSPQAEY